MTHFDDLVKIDYSADFSIFGHHPVPDTPPTHISRKPLFSGDLNARIEKRWFGVVLKIFEFLWPRPATMHTAEGPFFDKAHFWRPDTPILKRLNGHKIFFLTRPWTKQNDPGWLGVLSVPPLEVLEFLSHFCACDEIHQNKSEIWNIGTFQASSRVVSLL